MGNGNIKYNTIDSVTKDTIQTKLKKLCNKDDVLYIDYYYINNKYSIYLDADTIIFDNFTSFIEFLNCIDRMYIIDNERFKIRFVYGTNK